MKRFTLFVGVCLCTLFAAIPSGAQSASASLSGVVTDPVGAVVPNATVTARNISTNSRRTTNANGDGAYTISPLPIGTYEVKVAATGFEELTFPSVVLNVGQTVSLDAQLAVGRTTAELRVEQWSPPIVDRESSKVDSVIASREIENLPLNGRNYLELALLTPGNAPAPNFDPTKANTVLISSAGQMGRGSN